MIIQNKYFSIGFLQKVHGLDGQLILLPQIPYMPVPTRLFVYMHGVYVPYVVASWEEKGTKVWVRLSYVTTRTEASKLRGYEVFVDKKLLPRYMTLQQHMIGKLAKDINHGTLGLIKAIYPRKVQPCMVVDYHGKELLIPLFDGVIKSVEPHAITLTLPEDYLATMMS